LDEDTGETLFSVEVNAAGMIQVLEDDWLSKYARAIHGDTDVEARFLRVNPADRSYSQISNVDLIYTGETLLHIDSFLAFNNWLKAHLNEEGETPEEISEEMFEDIQSIVNWTSGAAAIDAVGWLLEFAAVSPVVAGLVTLASLAAGLYSALQDIIEVNNPEITAEQFYAVVYTTTAWVYGETSATTSYPTTDEDLGEFNPYIPQLPYSVPREVANPKGWFYVHDYLTSFGLGTMSKSLIKNKLNLLKGAWQDTAADTIDNLVNTLYDEATRVLTGGDPSLTLAQYQRRLRTVSPPGKNPRELTKPEFFKLFKAQTYKTFLENWTGPTAPVESIRVLDKRYRAVYPVPK
jgi:hypothetical protein